MLDLNFRVESAEVIRHAAAPTIGFKLHIAHAVPGPAVQSILLHSQIRIEPTRRQYTPDEQHRLIELFGTPDRWSQTVRSMLWAQVSTVVTSFAESITLDLPVPCTTDFNLAAAKYFHGLEQGDVAVEFLFSGTVFYVGEAGQLRIAQIPWEKEAAFRLPVAVWRNMMDQYYPNSAWLMLRRDVFDRLCEYRFESGQPTWDQAVEKLLSEVTQEATT